MYMIIYTVNQFTQICQQHAEADVSHMMSLYREKVRLARKNNGFVSLPSRLSITIIIQSQTSRRSICVRITSSQEAEREIGSLPSPRLRSGTASKAR